MKLLTFIMGMITLNNALGKYKDHEVHTPLLLTNVSKYQTIIECIYPEDISLAFFSFKTNEKNILMDCMFGASTCVILNDAFRKNFTALFTGRGGILIIKELNEDTYGNYSCYEMYNSSNVAVSTIEEPSLDLKCFNECGHYKKATIVCGVILAAAIIFGGVVFIIKRNIYPKLQGIRNQISQKENDTSTDTFIGSTEHFTDQVSLNGNGHHKESGKRRYYKRSNTRRRESKSPIKSVKP